ncbi:MAG: hypothetical protein KC435_00010 [Thermomicrobiales bacterium]|nr:hypothetical protein [Thermomicrobiales bacterium]
MRIFRHDPALRADYPQLAAIALRGKLLPDARPNQDEIAVLIERSRQRLAAQTEGEFPEVQAWRRVFSSMGHKPTQYRSAGEALLRRLRIDGDLPSILPIIDLCNAASVAYAVPIAVFDLDHIDGDLTVRYADGSEVFETFSGEIEHPAEHEVIFADGAGRAHARRWAHKQARTSAARSESTEILIVSEAMHEGALATQIALGETLVKLLAPMTIRLEEPVVVTEAGYEFS